MGINTQSNSHLSPLEQKKQQIDFEVKKEKEELNQLIVEEIENLSESDLIYIFSNLLGHSLEDGLALIYKLGIPNEIIMNSVKTVTFFIKHPDFVKQLRHSISIDSTLKDNDLANDYLEDTSSLPLYNKKRYFIKDIEPHPYFSLNRKYKSESDTTQISDKANEIVNKMNNIYGRYINLIDNSRTRNPELISNDDRSVGRQFGEDSLFATILRIGKYYTKNLIEILYANIESCNKDVDYREKQDYIYSCISNEYKKKLNSDVIPFEDVEEIIQIFIDNGLIDEKKSEFIYKKLSYYRPMDVVLHAKVRNAEDINVKELKQLLGTFYGENWEENISLEKNYTTGLYEIKKSKDNIEKREENQISNPYHMIRLIGILNGDIYCESKNFGPEETQYKIMKNGKEILENYENISPIGFANGNIYYMTKDNEKTILLENGIRILDQYGDIKYNEIIEGKLYCIVEKNGKYVLLENNKEISDEFDEIKCCDLELQQYNYPEEDLKKYTNIRERCVGRKNNKWILLNHGKKASREYDKITYYAQRDGNVYYLATKDRKKVLLKEGEEVSREYDEIILGFGDNGDVPYSAKIDNQRFLVGNGEETPTQYDNYFYRGYEFIYRMLDHDKYCFVKRPGEIFVAKNGEIVSNIYENYEYRWQDRINGKLYWCIEKDFHYILLENGKEILNGYRNIKYGESADGHIYCIAQKEDRKYVLLKDWNEILEGYDNISFCEIVDGNIYHLAKKDDKAVLLKNGEIFTQEYDDIDYGKWADGKLYSIAKLGGKQILLENGREITDRYDNISLGGFLEGKIYHNATKNGVGVLLENGKNILKGYDNVGYLKNIDGNIYCVAKKGGNEVVLENRKEISKEYNDIHFYDMINGNLYYSVENGDHRVLIENKIDDSTELKLPDEVKDKLEFLNLCMLGGNLTYDNILEVQAKIINYFNKQYNKEKRDEFNLNSMIVRCRKGLSHLFNYILKEQPEELIKTINPTATKSEDEHYAKSLFGFIFKNYEIGEITDHNVKKGEMMGGPNGGGNTPSSKTEKDLAQVLGNNDGMNLSSTTPRTTENNNGDEVDYSVLGDVSIGTFNHINSLLTVYQYSGFDFEHSTPESIQSFLESESTRIQGETAESNTGETNPGKMLFDTIDNFVSKSKFSSKGEGCNNLEKVINVMRNNISDDEHEILMGGIEYLKNQKQ